MNDKSREYQNFKGWNTANFGCRSRHWNVYFQWQILRCTRGNPGIRKLRLLEIGFGNGAFLGWAREQGHTVYGVEVNTSQLAAARQAGFSTASSLDELQTLFDITELDGVVAFDVFEHMRWDELREVLERLRPLLKPVGWVLARFPNGDSPFGRLNQHGDTTHVTTIGSVAVHQFATAAGFEVLSIRSDRMPILGVGVLRGLVYLVALSLRYMLEAPLQILLNAYYPGMPRWYALAPNLIVRMRLGN